MRASSAGPGEHVWHLVPLLMSLSLTFPFHAKEDMARFGGERHTHSVNTD